MTVQKSSIKLNTGSVVKNLSANAEDTGDVASISGLGRSPGEEHDYPLQNSCLGNPMNRSLEGYSSWGRKRVGHA